MVSLHYIIATYSGVYRKNENKEYVLQRQLQHLCHILRNRKDEDCLLKQITVVCPKPHHAQVYENYYMKEKWLDIFKKEFPHVKLFFLDYVGENVDHSYDQWLQGYEAFPDYDYHLIIEDDYCISKEKTDFDSVLIDLYKEKFPDNIGYLATWAAVHKEDEYHAAISNGLISRETFRKIPNILATYYNMKDVSYPQLKFSFLFTRNGVPLKDMTDRYTAMFWNSVTLKIEMCSEEGECLICPVQYTGLDTNLNAE